ncbi:PAS domain S-box protein [bacterium]|jgi:PAS domain S-box-containing protein|nr:PAS domain S-box protein [bacterium]
MTETSELANTMIGEERDTRLYQLLDSLSSGIFLANSNLAITYLNAYGNKCFERLCGQGLSSEDLLDHPTLANLRAAVTEAFDSKSVDRAEFSFADIDGKPMWMGFTLNCPETAEDSPPIVFGVFKDITHVKSLEQRQGWDNNLRSIALLSTGIAHEFNGMLGSLSGYLELYRKDKSCEPRFVTAVEEAVDKGLSIVNRLHNFACEDKTPNRSSDLIVSVMNVVSLLETELTRRGIVCNTSFQSHGKVNVPSDMMKKILLDLLTNSVHAISEFGTIDISVVGGDTSFEILEIRDTGKGISQTDLNSLFTPFFTGKADLGLDSEKGHGLGLFFVYSMLRDVGGEISVESLEGEGSLFRLKLPKSGE